MWYVIQVLKGREDAMAALIGRVVPAGVLDECFSPKYVTEAKVRGTWVPVQKDLFPGISSLSRTIRCRLSSICCAWTNSRACSCRAIRSCHWQKTRSS